MFGYYNILLPKSMITNLYLTDFCLLNLKRIYWTITPLEYYWIVNNGGPIAYSN